MVTMASDHVQGTPSPSASSIFLPLGRISRRNSKSSLNNSVDRNTLNEALDNIHTAASNSQSLTVFNDYTNPPAASSTSEGKGLAEEVQGGLSGLYNKLIASVSGIKADSESVDGAANTRHVAADSTPSTKLAVDEATKEQLDGVSQLPASNVSSRIQSPVATSFDLSASESRQKSSKLTSKAPSTVSKNSGPTTPALKSPVTVPQKTANGIVTEPSISELNINAYQSQKLRPRNMPTQESVSQNTVNDETQDVSSQLNGLRKALSGTVVQDTIPADREREPFSSQPAQADPTQTLQEGAKSQEHGSFKPLPSSFRDFDAVSNTVTTIGEGQTLDRGVLRRSDQPLSITHHGSNPLHLLDTSGEKTWAKNSISGDIRSPKSPSSPASRPREKLNTRVSQSHLPGFRSSRKSSSESIVTGRGSDHITFAKTDLDGSHDLSRASSRPLKPISSRLKSKLLSREFWMLDENAKDCFHCGEPFSTFRRKHHCRTCGQIFDNKCTLLIEGKHFGSSGSVRVCKPCEAIINAHDDDSSDDSIEELTMPESATARSRTPIVQQSLKTTRAMDDDSASIVSQSLEHMAKTPTMSFPVRLALDSKSGRSAVYEFDTLDRSLPRPSSSRSLRASHSIGHNHKRHHSRHQHIRYFKAYHEERAPFQRKIGDSLSRDMKQSNFHRDSIIDPDLAQYLSDDASSDDDQSDVFTASENGLSKSVPDGDKVSLGGLLAAVRKGKSRLAEKSIGSMLANVRDGDDASISSSRIANLPRPSRKRNLSVASSIRHRLSPKPTKENLGTMVHAGPEGGGASHLVNQFAPSGASKMTRSASMRGAGAPTIELNRASLHHVRKLLQQLLQDADIPRISSWETALLPILLKATDEVDPDVQRGDDIDIRHYVKLKKIPGGRPGDTTYVSGLVFTKNLALKSMSRAILQPKILIITFPLEYARHEQHFMSLEPVIRQEREYLQNLVNRIAALKPQLLLAQHNVSGLALQFLEKANIATAYNVKPAVLEAVSRCTRTRIIHTIDKLAVHPAQTGTCDSFEVKTFVFEGRKKTYIYLSGCQPQLGCTIILRGAENSILSKIKRITEFMVYVVYNLKLETCLMRDEFALIPSTEVEQMAVDKKTSNITGAPQTLPATAHTTDGNGIVGNDEKTTADSLEEAVTEKPVKSPTNSTLPPAVRVGSADSNPIPDDVPVPKFYEDLVEKHQTKILSASPFVKFMQPYLLMRARELERRVAYLKTLRDQEISYDQSMDEKVKAQKFTLIQPEMVHASLSGASVKVREVLHAVHDAEYDKALHNYETQKKQWEAFISGNKNLFDPYAHQNIVVLFSLVSTFTSIPCSGPDLLAFSFYNEHETEEQFEADCTLGQYVEDLCFRANDICPSPNCEKLMFEHHRQYVHGQAQVSVFVQPYPSKMRGMQDTILMWSQCKVCGNETPVTPMSMSTWKYSFGKYLELSFWSSDLHARAGVCPHDLHRDHLRYFGYKNFALRIHYDSIDLLEIIVPRMRITWKVDNDLKFKNEVFTKIEQRLNKFMVSVKSRLKGINLDAVLPEKAEACRVEIERLAKKASEEHLALIRQLQEQYSNSKHWETIPLNRAVRITQESVAEWDNAFAKFEKDFFPSEKDIRRLATLQLKKIFLDRDVSVTSITSIEEGTITPPSEVTLDEKSIEPDATPRPSRPRRMTQLSPEKTQDVLQAVMKEHARLDSEEHATIQESVHEEELTVTSDSEKAAIDVDPPDVRHLDLAITTHPQASHPETSESTTSVSSSSTSTSHLLEPISREPDRTILSTNVPSANDNGRRIPEADPKRTPPVHLPTPTKIPRANESATGRIAAGKTVSPPLLRAQSQPAGLATPRRELSNTKTGTMSAIHATQGFGSNSIQFGDPINPPTAEVVPNGGDKKLSERLGLNRLKGTKLGKGHSFIPRSITGKKNSRVSNLAKHFEQLSREFEKERIRERKLRAAKSRQSRVYPLASSKPIVEVYKSVDDAVQERDTSDESFMTYDQPNEDTGDTNKTLSGMADTNPAETSGESFHAEETPAETTETDADGHDTSRAQSDAEGEEDHSDVDQELQDISTPESPEDLPKMSPEDLDLKELPKHERSSLMKMLTNFWAERSSSGWTSLDYPLSSADHVFADCDIIVREDEPSSVIAFALDSEDYKSKLWEIQEHTNHSTEKTDVNAANPTEANQAEVMHSLLRKTGTHLKYQFQEGPAKALCKIFFAEQFDAVRRRCGVSDRIVESLSRCMKWDSKGGKTKSLFLKTLDDRFVLKSLSPIETQSFLKFAPNYFQIMSEAFFHELPSVIAKMLGFYQIIIKNPVTGVEYNWFLLVMENLFYDRTPTRIFDLKGSMRNRKIQSTGERNEVLLDENMVEFIYESPLFARDHSKKLLRSSVHNDTLFLARQNVMDYSLMMAIDENRKELVVGIIDCIRTYTWDKKLESWIKDRGFAGGSKNRPTVTSPKEYKKRFREAMGRYVLEAPK
jgi:1-phosphatidylinositol-3-phosphate 5-kinase